MGDKTGQSGGVISPRNITGKLRGTQLDPIVTFENEEVDADCAILVYFLCKNQLFQAI
jgi:hypothetical protein